MCGALLSAVQELVLQLFSKVSIHSCVDEGTELRKAKSLMQSTVS